MVCSAAILSASLALSLLNNATLPSESFVFSPISLNTALSILLDGASGITQQQLNDFLLPGCSPSEVTSYYSSHSQLAGVQSNVTFTSANRFYLDTDLVLKKDYQHHIQEKYNAMVLNINLRNKASAAREMNEFVVEATNGKIRDLFEAETIRGVAYLINAVYFNGPWKEAFDISNYRTQFHGHSGTRTESFITTTAYFRAQFDCDYNEIHTDRGYYYDVDCSQSTAVVLLPYKDESYNFLIVLPGKSSNLDNLRSELNGESLLNLVKNVREREIKIFLPKFKIESTLNALSVLRHMGVNNLKNLSKVSDAGLEVSEIKQKAMIEVNEKGTEAAAATYIGEMVLSARYDPPSIVVDRPFLFGILHDDEILFLGQYA